MTTIGTRTPENGLNDVRDGAASIPRFIFVPLTDPDGVASEVATAEVEVTRAVGVRSIRITPEGDVVVNTA